MAEFEGRYQKKAERDAAREEARAKGEEYIDELDDGG